VELDNESDVHAVKDAINTTGKMATIVQVTRADSLASSTARTVSLHVDGMTGE
jgi:hypothetical protein